MRYRSLYLALSACLVFSIAACNQAPPPAESTTKADHTPPDTVKKTKTGKLLGKMDNDVRKKVGVAGIEE